MKQTTIAMKSVASYHKEVKSQNLILKYRPTTNSLVFHIMDLLCKAFELIKPSTFRAFITLKSCIIDRKELDHL